MRPSLAEFPIQYVKGVGPARAELLRRLEIETVEDFLLTVPRRYEDRTSLVHIGELVDGQVATLRARIVEKRFRPIRGGHPLVEALLADDTGTAACRWFNQPYLAKLLDVGGELILHGKVERHRRFELINPEIERIEPDSDEASLHAGRIVPIHPLTAGVSQRWFRRTMKAVVDRFAEEAPELLPSAISRRLGLPAVGWSLREVHFPSSWDDLAKAQRRLAFEELFLMQVRLALRRARMVARPKPRRYQRDGLLTRALARRLPFALTASQQRVLGELVEELCRPPPMLRLLQGDVGCGKTVVAALLIAAVIQSGFQVALMAPTELLAQQHARVLADYLEPLGVRAGLLVQGISAPERARLLTTLAAGEIDLLVGTQAMLQDPVAFRELALVIIDEQHKFGVTQRSALAKKAVAPDVLVMTATPIPRTMALSMYGDLSCSTITELPPGRQPITTHWFAEAQRGEVYELIRRQVREGRQGYIVYPLVEETDRSDLKAATQMSRQLQQIFPEFRLALLHGQMRPADQAAAMDGFVHGRVQLLISTVIIEVGLDVPNATVMLIEHPERFGLAQLHQLRGRIGRGAEAASCFVLSDTPDELARSRLTAFVETTDGFRLAEQDLALRGPGELLGSRQHGWLRFRVANLVRDRELLDAARREAMELVARDPQLASGECALLKQRLKIAQRPA